MTLKETNLLSTFHPGSCLQNVMPRLNHTKPWFQVGKTSEGHAQTMKESAFLRRSLTCCVTASAHGLMLGALSTHAEWRKEAHFTCPTTCLQRFVNTDALNLQSWSMALKSFWFGNHLASRTPKAACKSDTKAVLRWLHWQKESPVELTKLKQHDILWFFKQSSYKWQKLPWTTGKIQPIQIHTPLAHLPSKASKWVVREGFPNRPAHLQVEDIDTSKLHPQYSPQYQTSRCNERPSQESSRLKLCQSAKWFSTVVDALGGTGLKARRELVRKRQEVQTCTAALYGLHIICYLILRANANIRPNKFRC